MVVQQKHEMSPKAIKRNTAIFIMFIVIEIVQGLRCKATLKISSVYCLKFSHYFSTLKSNVTRECHTEIKHCRMDIDLEMSFLVKRPAVAIEDYMLKCMNYYFSHFKSNDMFTVLIEIPMHLFGVYSCEYVCLFVFFLQQTHGMYLQK